MGAPENRRDAILAGALEAARLQRQCGEIGSAKQLVGGHGIGEEPAGKRPRDPAQAAAAQVRAERLIGMASSPGISASIDDVDAAAVREHVWPLLESGAVKPVVHATFPQRDAAEAHRVMESGAHIGKLVLVASS